MGSITAWERGKTGAFFIMAEEETQDQTEEATQDGAETDEPADTKDAEQDKPKFTQEEIDRRISDGIKAYISKREKEAEEQKKQDAQLAAIQEGKFEEALKMTRAELDAIKAESSQSRYERDAQNILIKMDMAHFADSIIPYAKDIDQVIQQAKVIQETAEKQAQSIVEQRLNTGPNRTPANTHKTPDKTPDQMSAEEFAEYKRARKLV